jgi:aspartyl-tRNA(Asn)/glutamyl-tRNA(Gln) amidotransferase subunit C
MVSKEEVKRLADLSKISVPADQLEKLSQNLGDILNHFQELEALNTEGVLPMSGGTDLTNVLREDEVSEFPDRAKLIKSFPKEKDGYNSVPPVFN